MTGSITGHQDFMSKATQRRTVAKHRRRLKSQGMSRYEVRGLTSDRELVRSIARRLAAGDARSAQLRIELGDTLTGAAVRRGGILEALRRSPLVGAELKLKRSSTTGRPSSL
jgi:hypothetical protein